MTPLQATTLAILQGATGRFPNSPLGGTIVLPRYATGSRAGTLVAFLWA